MALSVPKGINEIFKIECIKSIELKSIVQYNAEVDHFFFLSHSRL